MTDPEDKTGRHGSWANKISITTLVVFVFGAGGAFVEAKFTRRAVDELSAAVKVYAETNDKRADAHERRTRILEDDRTAREAVERNERREERKRR